VQWCREQAWQSASFTFGSNHSDCASKAAKKKRGTDQDSGRRSIQAGAHADVVRIHQTEQQHHRRWKYGPKNQAAFLPPLFKQQSLRNCKRLD
jgi:hypothetical protein